jgi:nucleoside-diphosphate-sugar epimerase
MTDNIIVVTGAGGYIGKYLVSALCARNYSVNVISRTADIVLSKCETNVHVSILDDISSIEKALEPGSIMVILAFMRKARRESNLEIISNILPACERKGVKRLLHCSTADVVGRNSDNVITESSECRPLTQYSKMKLKIERLVINRSNGEYEAGILRPTAVFGQGSENLKKLAHDLSLRNDLFNYLKSCLFDLRRMTLVHISNVISSTILLVNIYKGETEWGDILHIR